LAPIHAHGDEVGRVLDQVPVVQRGTWQRAGGHVLAIDAQPKDAGGGAHQTPSRSTSRTARSKGHLAPGVDAGSDREARPVQVQARLRREVDPPVGATAEEGEHADPVLLVVERLQLQAVIDGVVGDLEVEKARDRLHRQVEGADDIGGRGGGHVAPPADMGLGCRRSDDYGDEAEFEQVTDR
jgi:hypothetical protein